MAFHGKDTHKHRFLITFQSQHWTGEELHNSNGETEGFIQLLTKKVTAARIHHLGLNELLSVIIIFYGCKIWSPAGSFMFVFLGFKKPFLLNLSAVFWNIPLWIKMKHLSFSPCLIPPEFGNSQSILLFSWQYGYLCKFDKNPFSLWQDTLENVGCIPRLWLVFSRLWLENNLYSLR